MIDALSYMIPPLDFSKNFHLNNPKPGGNPQYNLQNPLSPTSGWWWSIKGAAGFPWDGNYYDQNYIYQNITEGPSGWTDPSSYKVFASKSWPNGHGGIAWCPRYHNPAPYQQYLITEDSTYQTWLAGVLQATQNLSTVQCLTQGPFQLDLGGDIKMQSVLVHYYLWGAGLATQEQHWYALGYGLVRWQKYALQNGVYVLTTDDIFNSIVAGGTPALNFPNPLP